MLGQVDAQEELNDLLEDHFDAVCAALKSGRRRLDPELTDAAAWPAPKAIVWATACSLRALKLEGKGPLRAVHLLWELEGRDAGGARGSGGGGAGGTGGLGEGRWGLAPLCW